jgi:hypothetical protein
LVEVGERSPGQPIEYVDRQRAEKALDDAFVPSLQHRRVLDVDPEPQASLDERGRAELSALVRTNVRHSPKHGHLPLIDGYRASRPSFDKMAMRNASSTAAVPGSSKLI